MTKTVRAKSLRAGTLSTTYALTAVLVMVGGGPEPNSRTKVEGKNGELKDVAKKSRGVFLLACCAAILSPSFVAADDPADIYVPANPRLEAMPHHLLITPANPTWDTDSDGLPDTWEQTHFSGLSETTAGDPDGDGMPNIAEYNLGTDPNVNNTESDEECNAAPTLTVTTSSAGATELEMFGVLARADDPEGEQVRFYIDYSSIGAGDDDEPEFYADPAEPNAHLYWIPGETRGGSSYNVTVYAVDESDICASPATVSISVTDTPSPTVGLADASAILFDGTTLTSPQIASIGEGSRLTVSNMVLNSGDEEVGLRILFDPPLDPESLDFPFIIKSSYETTTSYTFVWIPNSTRAGTGPTPQRYTVTLQPYYDDRPSTAASHTFYIDVIDMPLAGIPTTVVAAGQTLDFDLDLSNYHGDKTYTVFSKRVAPPGATFDYTGHFTWGTTAADEGKTYKLGYQANCGPDSSNFISKQGDYYIRVLPPVGDPDEGNLVMNPNFVHDVTDTSYVAGSDSLPDGWTKEDNDPSITVLDWVNNTLTSENLADRCIEAPNDPSGGRWVQRVELPTTPGVSIPGGSVYEFSATYSTTDVHHRVWTDGRSSFAQGIGVSISFTGPWTNQFLHTNYYPTLTNFETGFADWSDSDGCYHSDGSHSSTERTYTCYVITPPGAKYAFIGTNNPAPGKITLSHVSFRPVASDPLCPPFAPFSNISQILDDNNEAFFPIGMLREMPTYYNGELIPMDALRRMGGNLMTYQSDLAAEHIATGLYAYGETNVHCYGWNTLCDPTDTEDEDYEWCKDQTHGGFYPGLATGVCDGIGRINPVSHYYSLDLNNALANELVAETANGLRVVLLDGPDESNFRTTNDGSPTELRELNYAATTLKSIINRPYLLNFMSRDGYADRDYPHATLADIISFSWNLPQGASIWRSNYYSTGRYIQQEKLSRTGEILRKWQETSKLGVPAATPKPIFSMATGVREWTAYDKYIPFHYQRFAIYDQIVNGAAGMRFYGVNNIDLADEDAVEALGDRYHWSQIQELTAEMGLLYEVLAEPTCDTNWSFTPTDALIEAMLKEYDGKLYLIATNASEEAVGTVTFTLPSALLPNGIGKITALFESDRTISEYELDTPDDGFLSPADWCAIRQRGATRVNWARTVYAKAGFTTFSDYFGDYAVHVYEIEPPSGMFVDSDEDGLPDNWETALFGTLDYSGNDDVEAPFGGDGLTNAQEYALRTNPIIADTDGDSLWDGQEVNVLGTLPTSADTDTDGINDNVDNCPNSFNSLQEDEDGDGVGDVCDLCLGTAAGMPVTDTGCNDCNTNGVRDGCDIDSGYSTDNNANGIPDACE